MRLPRLVSFRGAMHAGKTTASDHLAYTYGYKKLSFAAAVKIELFDLLNCSNDRLSVEDADKVKWVNDHKEELRFTLQRFATDRHRFDDPDYWLDKVTPCIHEEFAKGNRVVIDDARFENEIEMLYTLGAASVLILRPYGGELSPHTSESLARVVLPTDCAVVHNDATVSVLKLNIERTLVNCGIR